MRVLMLGGTGLTGPFVVRRLAALGHEVAVFHRGQHGAELPGVRQVYGSAADPPHSLRSPAPDVVVHMWAMTAAHANTFLEVFRSYAGRAVLISSCDVYRAFGRLKRTEGGPPEPIPIAEDAPLRESRYPYRGAKNVPLDCSDDYDKILVEETCRAQTELPVTVLRFPAVYGPNDYHRFRQWLQPMFDGAPELKVQDSVAAWRWTHGFAEDVAEAVVLAATNERAAGRTYNVGEERTPTWAERIAELGRAAEWSGRIVPAPAEELPEAQRVALNLSQHLVTDTRRIRGELGYREVVPREEGYRRTIAWERLK
jgi:nucleoside-diphosphate-sugar epimerase